jgi:hypothetical protein
VAIGTWIAWLVVPGQLNRSDSTCLISFFSILFLYHRDYDTVILALPLVNCAERMSAKTGQARGLYAACGLIVIAVLYMNAGYLRMLAQWCLNTGAWGRLVQATILPSVTWLILLAMILTVRAPRAEKDHLRAQPRSDNPGGPLAAGVSG